MYLRSFPSFSIRCYQNEVHRNFEFHFFGVSTTRPLLRSPDNMRHDSQNFMLFWILRFQVHCLYAKTLFTPWLCSWNVDVYQKRYSCQKFGVGLIRAQPTVKPKMRERKLRSFVNSKGALMQKGGKQGRLMITRCDHVCSTHTHCCVGHTLSFFPSKVQQRLSWRPSAW